MTNQNNAAQPVLTDEEINAACDWPASNTTMRAENDRAMAREVEAAVLRKLSKLRAPVADERAALTHQDIYDRFQFLEGLVNEQRYKQIAETAIAIYESGAPWAAMADTIRDLRAELGYVAQYGKRELPNMCPPATSRDRWMYEQGRLAERAALASAPVAGEAQPVAWEDVRDSLAMFLSGATGKASKHWIEPLEDATANGPLAKMRACLAAPQASEAVRDAGIAASGINVEAAAMTLAECMHYPWANMPEQGRAQMRIFAQSVVSAALSAQPGAQRTGGSDA